MYFKTKALASISSPPIKEKGKGRDREMEKQEEGIERKEGGREGG